MSAENKNRLEVQKLIRDNIIRGLEASGYDPARFAVLEAGQNLPTAKENYITFRMVKSDRAGWPKIDYSPAEEDCYRKDTFLELQEWEIAVFRRRKTLSDGADTQMESDVVQLLMAWFNGMGCDDFRTRGISNLLAVETPQKEIKDEGELKQRNPSFTLPLCVPKVIKYRHKVMDVVKPKLMPV